jgi:hypothetical protein
MLGGIVLLKHKGMATPEPLSQQPLYQSLEKASRGEQTEVELTFIPYYAWANRLPGAMEVWIPYVSAGRVAVGKQTTAPKNPSPP